MDTFDIILLSILAIAVVAIFAIDLWRQRKKGGLTLETAEEIAASVISRVALALVTDAERTYGEGTGELKMSACIAKLIEMLPASVVEIVPKSFLQESLEKALAIAKLKWAKNARLLDKEKGERND